MKYIITTLGCKVNQYETQAIETLLQARGHEPGQKGQADVVIINTCAVTAESGRKSRQAVRRLMEDNPGAISVVCGCWAQTDAEKAESLKADVLFGSGDRVKLVEAIEDALDSHERIVSVDRPFERREFEDLPAGAFSGHARAYLKIEDGCANFCTYCIIPYARGRVRSLPPARAGEKAAALAAQGYRELVVTGIEIASYGRDLEGRPGLSDVVCAISRAAPGLRLRLGSLEPTVVTEDFCRAIQKTGGVCRHFHLSLQSGCDETLRRMNRKYDTERFFSAVTLIREYFPGCAVTADLITGFPGETEEQHGETLAFITKCGFADMHIFPYSRRPGTPADKMAGQLTHAVKSRRAAQAQQAADRMKTAYLYSQIGAELPVLFETEAEGVSVGHADNYALVSAVGERLRGVVKNVKITGVSGEMLVGHIV
ncbi:MAG TPA: tRNA (N(6)-L-threonylcarbamoyladenosine(37)-C(2))-methylthiotransferase MtaB [Clostridiales bacterium]|nr:tRNA (N(6)-L-threonylcarbamoyladenosine(37)-C(2))-methylthiotransferase MtaB [Clostridiales bacterium]